MTMRTLLAAMVCGWLLAAAGCNKTDKHADAAHQPATYTTPSQEALERSTMLGRDGTELAAQAGQATPQQLKEIGVLLKIVIPERGFTLDEASGAILPPGGRAKGEQFDSAVNVIAGKLISDKSDFSTASIKATCEQYLNEQQQLLAAHAREAEIAANTDPAGRSIEKTTQPGQALPKLDPAAKIVGKWKSLREVTRDNTYSINHSTNYHEELEVMGNGTARWIYYRSGAEFSNDVFDYDYDSKTGQLTLKLAGGGVYQTLHVYTSQFDVGQLYIDTPGVDRLKVFGPATGGA